MFSDYEHIGSCLICNEESLRVVDTLACIVQCTGCHFKFVTPRPTQEAIAHSYSEGKTYDSWLKEEDARQSLWERRFAIIRKLKSNGSLLDIGAGLGTFLQIAKENGFDVRGTEISTRAISLAKTKYGLDLLPGPIDYHKFAPASFDIITMWHVLEHVPYPLQTLDICSNLLKTNGYLVIAVPNDDSLIRFICKLFRRPFYKALTVDDEIHLSHFTPKTIKYLIDKFGLSMEILSLDNYLPKQSFKSKLYYKLNCIICLTTRYNVYHTILCVARKV